MSQCDNRYVERTRQKSEDRIKHHIPEFIRTRPNLRKFSLTDHLNQLKTFWYQTKQLVCIFCKRKKSAKSYYIRSFFIWETVKSLFYLATL